jgi:hypothetical protein
MHQIHGGGPMWKNFRITDDLSEDVANSILEHPSYKAAPAWMLPFDPNREVPTSGGIAGEPLNLTDEQRARLPRLEPLGDGPIDYAVGFSDGSGQPLVIDGSDAPIIMGGLTQEEMARTCTPVKKTAARKKGV